jgi:hypothetical protein
VAIAFNPPSLRAASSDLTIAISPLGLVELADEEFEVHGPRLNRYATNWAFYLGHHWAHQRPAGEPQLTFNFVRALADFLVDFQFGKGIAFRTPEATEAIVPNILRRVWEEDNDKATLLNEIGQLGGVCGDVFIKVAYEEPYVDVIGRLHPGRVRLLPLNPSFCFPEYHPHDRDRLIRFKLKYRFWGTSLEGTRQVFTYVELITDEEIQEFVNDELIDVRPNPIGRIPVAQVRNLAISSSPWGLSDIQEITGLQREFNEKATELSDIINYTAAPVTVITGAKASNLEKGPKKVWSIPVKDAKVQNLTGDADIGGTLAYLELIKRTMHELTGVPETALGQEQPVSNTSGVALAILYLPLMFRYNRKVANYTKGIKDSNELIMLTIVVKEPQTLLYDPTSGIPLRPDNYAQLDPADPLTYKSDVHWPPPLPIDVMLKLQEISEKMAIGIESKIGALRELGEEMPETKMREIFEEQLEDVKNEGALEVMRGMISMVVTLLSGGLQAAPQPGSEGPSSTDGSSGVSSAANPISNPAAFNPAVLGAQLQVQADIFKEIVARAYGTEPPVSHTP